MRKNQNKSYYHYKAVSIDEDGNEIQTDYFMTIKNLTDNYNCCKATILNNLRDPDRKVRNGKFNNIKLYRIHEPVMMTVPNPNL